MEGMDQGLYTKQVNHVLAEMEDYAQMCDENSGAEVTQDPLKNISIANTLVSSYTLYTGILAENTRPRLR